MTLEELFKVETKFEKIVLKNNVCILNSKIKGCKFFQQSLIWNEGWYITTEGGCGGFLIYEKDIDYVIWQHNEWPQEKYKLEEDKILLFVKIDEDDEWTPLRIYRRKDTWKKEKDTSTRIATIRAKQPKRDECKLSNKLLILNDALEAVLKEIHQLSD